MSRLARVLLITLVLVLLPVRAAGGSFLPSQAVTYYVSSSSGDDGNDGLSPAAPFASVGKVNSLALQPGDRVLFRCGDTWRADPLQLVRSGAAGQPITYSSYPEGCLDRPILSGAQPIAGWALYSGNIYVADLAAGQNAGKFGYGVNQLFRDDQRLPMGRWPNLDEGDAGYSTIDDQPAGNRLTDTELPAGDWTGAVVHIRGMRWYILNREVTGDTGQTLTLGASAGCWDGSCAGWGYFLNNHLGTLDREGEWYYDKATQRIYLYTAGGLPGDEQVEGSVVLRDDDRAWGGIVLGEDLGVEVSYVTVANLQVSGWFRNGITTPTNLAHYEIHDVTLRDNAIRDVDGIGLNLMTWVYDPYDGRPDGWRGGYGLVVSGNTIEVANRMGINTYSRDSTFADNTLRDIALVENLGAAGMGCAMDDGEGQCTEDGDGLRIKIDQADDSGNGNVVSGNRLERIGYNGMDVFGYNNTFLYNVIRQACYSKGDCGGVRTFGRDGLDQTAVHDLLFQENIIVDTIGNTDGCNITYSDLFGFGLYIDNYSRDVIATGNTIIDSTSHGILYQNSTGTVTGNTLYNNSYSWGYGAQLYIGSAPAYVASHTGNILYSLGPQVRTLALDNIGGLAGSDGNYFFNPYQPQHIWADGDRTLATWQSFSGMDATSHEAWFSQSPGEEPLSRIFYNETAQAVTVDLRPVLYLDLDQNEVRDSLVLGPYSSQVLIYTGEVTAPDLSPSRKAASPSFAASGDRITYTVTLLNAGAPLTRTVTLTDAVPAGLTYISGTLVASTGVVTDSEAPLLRWSGLLTPAPSAVITYVVTVDVISGTPSLPRLLTNVASITAPGVGTMTRSASICVDFRQIYLPLVLKQ